MSSPLKSILHINASARTAGSVTRDLGQTFVTRLLAKSPDAKVIIRDVSQGVPFLNEEWIGATFTDPAARSAEQKMVLALSDTLVEELKEADTIVIGTPVYNFSIPATLKAWVDMVARARETFQYTVNGPVGLLQGKKAYVIIASGGTKIGSEIDFAGNYLKHILGFIGISDVTMIAADQLMIDPENRDAALAQTIELAA
jgi:FMN-dependent NADH-azoreductase